MIRAKQIPDEVAFALLDIYALWLGDTDQARAAIAAALNAWPGVYMKAYTEWTEVRLPLTENINAEP